jgi:hypothetical protein
VVGNLLGDENRFGKSEERGPTPRANEGRADEVFPSCDNDLPVARSYRCNLEIFDPCRLRLYISPDWPNTNPTIG